jgi:hypothetical protein
MREPITLAQFSSIEKYLHTDRLAEIRRRNRTDAQNNRRIHFVCEVFFWRDAIPLFTVTYEPYWKGD